jgi:glycosyltransferase involved in cell wall biosynthesis
VRIYAFHDESGCGWYRIRLPLGQLAERGHEVRMLLGRDVQPTDTTGYPLIVGQRMDKHAALPAWRRMRAHSRLVYEIDDDVFSVEKVNWMAYGTYGRQDAQDAVAHAAAVADLVTVTTEPLAEVMRRHNPNVAVLPNHIPDALLEHQRPRRDKVVVGWAGGASHALDMHLVSGALRRFLDRNKHAEMHLIGTDYRPTVGRAGRYTEWDSDPWGYYRGIDFDIGLAPLADSVFARSKSHIKALEYAALGIPVIASDVEPYRGIVLDGVTGYLVRHEHEWGKRLYELAGDEAMREEMSHKAREHAAQWAISRGVALWEKAYEGILT